jgi:hypothetical protein
MITRALFLLLLVLGGFDLPIPTIIKSAGYHQRYNSAMASNTGCNACRMHEEIRALSLEAIKEQILNKLGLKQAPNMTGRALPRIPPISKLMDMYGMQADQPQSHEPGITHHEEIDEFSAKTETVFALAQPHQKLRHSKSYPDVLYFKFSDKVIQHKVMKAELSLWLYGSEENEDINTKDTVTITLQRILRGTGENGGPLLGPSLTTKYQRPVGKGKWKTIDLKRMVSEWFKYPRDNLGVNLKISTEKSNKPGSRIIETNPEATHSPYLEVQTQELDSRRGSRIKRNVGLNCDEATQERRCCRYKLTVDFEKFGWDWIIAPKKYDANYCSGDCPMAFLPVYPNTHIVSLAEPPNNTGPCCAPRRLSEITMLYFDNEYQIVFSRLPGMVVERCGCS